MKKVVISPALLLSKALSQAPLSFKTLTLWKNTVSYFVQCASTWAYVMFRCDYVQSMRIGHRHCRKDACLLGAARQKAQGNNASCDGDAESEPG